MADYPVTLSDDRISTLSNQERLWGFNRKFKIKAADIAVTSAVCAVDTVTVTLGTTPDRYAIVGALANVTTAFAGTTALTIMVGVTGDTDACIASTTVKTAGPINNSGNNTVPAANAKGTASSNIVAVFTNATGGSPSAITAGEVDVYLNIINLDNLG